jgi:outer membrane protein OmpA-like peptidoglycan-associated protein
MWLVTRKIVFFAGIFAAALHIQAQNSHEPSVLSMAETGAYSILERSDWLRYDNGKYTGLVRHEVRATIIPKPAEQNNSASASALDKVFLYQGSFFVLQNTLRDMRQSAQPVDAVIPVSFKVLKNGTVVIENDQGFPAMRSFPAFPAQSVRPGLKWIASGNRAADPLNLGNPVIVPFTAEYEYRGIEKYRDVPVHRIYAAYAVRYQNSAVMANSYAKVQGYHKVDILIRVEDGLPVFMRDDLDETYTLAGGSTVRLKGFTLTFGTGIIPMDRGEVIASLGNKLHIEKLPDPDVVVSTPPALPQAAPSPISEAEDRPVVNTGGLQDSAIDLTPVPEGIRLTMRNIHFVADSAELLPAERPRLDLLADALKQIPDRTFLVEGHTAATGRPTGEMELSLERAKRIVDELVRRGIAADRFIYKGWGGTKPVGNNTTNDGRSANRRVEITILE